MKVRHLNIEIGEEGELLVSGSKTIERYRELRESDNNKDCYSYGVFFAFSNEQFEEGKRLARINAGEKIFHAGAGLYGTREGIGKYFASFRDTDKIINAECDAQEVYLYEYNNHECMFSFDGDLEAIKIIVSIYGDEVAKTIHRFRACYEIDDLKF